MPQPKPNPDENLKRKNCYDFTKDKLVDSYLQEKSLINYQTEEEYKVIFGAGAGI